MHCKELRDRMIAGKGQPLPQQLEDHLADCDACARFANRVKAARTLFENHHGNLEPDAGFAGRVVASLPQQPADMFGWAALRLLPATLVMVLVLAFFAFKASPQPSTYEDQAPTDDLLSWVVERTEDDR